MRNKDELLNDLKLDMPKIDPVEGMKCHICGKPTTNKYKPFCSKRCADIDLDKWFNGNYVIHTEEAPNDDALNQ